MTRISSGDEAAFEHLYDRYASKVMGFLNRILGEQGVAAEVLQELFIRLWDRRDSYDPTRARLTTWMFGIARNMAIDRLRRMNRRPSVVKNEAEERWLEQTPDGGQSVADLVSREMRHVRLKAAETAEVEAYLAGHPERRREVESMSDAAALTQSLVSQGWLASYLLDDSVIRFPIAGTAEAPASYGQFLLRENGRQGLLVVADLSPLDEDQTCQFWVIDSDREQALSAGLLAIGADGVGILRVDLDNPISDFEAIGLSIEPAGGSSIPSDEIVMLAELR